ncbi:MAG: hypothetical protein IPH31_14045 [Lewinellaceae bacterium]|nr:hypothetical protein [Lewinellaceae bacterium]
MVQLKSPPIEEDSFEVQVGEGIFGIEPVTWEDIEYKWNKEENKIEKEIVGTFTQFPSLRFRQST